MIYPCPVIKRSAYAVDKMNCISSIQIRLYDWDTFDLAIYPHFPFDNNKMDHKYSHRYQKLNRSADNSQLYINVIHGEGASLGDHLIPFPHQFVMIAPPFTDSLFSRLQQVKSYVVTDIGWKNDKPLILIKVVP